MDNKIWKLAIFGNSRSLSLLGEFVFAKFIPHEINSISCVCVEYVTHLPNWNSNFWTEHKHTYVVSILTYMKHFVACSYILRMMQNMILTVIPWTSLNGVMIMKFLMKQRPRYWTYTSSRVGYWLMADLTCSCLFGSILNYVHSKCYVCKCTYIVHVRVFT